MYVPKVDLEEMEKISVAEFKGKHPLHFGYALFLYVAEVIPVIIGSLVNTVALIMIPSTWSKAQKRVTAICLSPLLPSP